MVLLTTFLLLAISALAQGWWWGGSSSSSSPIGGSKIASTADSHIGDTKWSLASSYSVGSGENKCNIFVADVLEEAGGDVPNRYVWESPIGAGEWGNPSSSYLVGDSCWTNVASPAIGDVIGDGVHVGIVTGYRLTTSARFDKVVKNDFGFGAGPVTYWRYTC